MAPEQQSVRPTWSMHCDYVYARDHGLLDELNAIQESVSLEWHPCEAALLDVCVHCRSLNLGGAFNEVAKSKMCVKETVYHRRSLKLTADEQTVDHPSFHSMEELKKSAEVCQLCTYLYIAIKQDMISEPGYTSEALDCMPLSALEIVASKLICHFKSPMTGVEELSIMGMQEVEDNIRGIEVQPMLKRFRKTNQDHLVPTNPSIEYIANKVSYWSASCIAQHSTCRFGLVNNPMPDRVLSLGTRDHPELRLQCFENMTGSYVSLSYCWGNDHGCKTTTENIETYEQTINFNSLPKTYRDAVELCRALGYQYLWVDALCIIQGDVQDWSQQSAKMDSIYGNAALTICASRAADVVEGFLSPRRLAMVHCGIAKQDGHLKTVMVGSNTCSLSDSSEPLARRGWAAQERQLSPRTINFCREQMIWECNTTSWYEDEDGIRRLGLIPSHRSVPTSKIVHSLGKNHRSIQWADFTKRVSGSNFKYSSDLLPAISGIAKKMSSIFGDTYLAGHWKSTLLMDLMWEPAYTTRKRPSKLSLYRAPSWSWAAIQGEIYYHRQELNPCSSIVDVQVTSKEAGGLGEVMGGFVLISAPRLIARPFLDEGKMRMRIESGGQWFEMPKPGVMKARFLDKEVEPFAREYYALITHGGYGKHHVISDAGFRIQIEGPVYSGLLLLSIDDGSDSYCRVGGFSHVLSTGTLDPELRPVITRIV